MKEERRGTIVPHGWHTFFSDLVEFAGIFPPLSFGLHAKYLLLTGHGQ
jgi:hypothetical protein